MKSDVNALIAYVNMLIDGTAFSNWENKPTPEQRRSLVESLFYKGVPTRFQSKIKKVIMEAESTDEIKRLLSSMEIKEEDFMV